MEAVLACGPVGVEDSFFDLGGNSLSAVRLTTVIRERLKLQIQVRDVFMFPSPAMLAGRVEHGGGLPAGSLVPLNHGGHDGGGRVYCAHTLSGEVGIYRPLASRLDCRVHGLRDESGALEPEQAELEARGQAFARTILNEGRGDGPTVILGWSFGACVALETARALRAAGAAAELVLIEPAELDVPISDNREQVILALFMQEWRSAFDLAAGRDLPTVPSTLEELYRLALDQGVLPRTIELATLRERFSRFRRNLNALWHYRPLDYDGPGRVIWSENADNADHRSVWKKILANVKHDIVPGTHRSVMRNPGITRIDSLVRKCLIGPIDDQSSLKTIAMDFNLLN
jgi:thioesterase domain-containing protein